VYASRRQPDVAFEWLERARRERDFGPYEQADFGCARRRYGSLELNRLKYREIFQ
jgi:hypothetical protein